MKEKRRFIFEVGIDRDGLEIYSEVEDINKEFDWDEEDEEYDDCNLSEIVGNGCKSLISYYENYSDSVYEYKDYFIKRIMRCKDVDIDWDEDVEKYFIEVFFDGDVEKMKNYKEDV